MRSLTTGILATVAAVLGVATSSFAGSGVSGSMLQPGPPGYNRDACGGAATMVPGAGFTNGFSTSKYKFAGTCSGVIVLSKLTTLPLGDGIPGTGDEAICLVNFQSNAPGPCGSFVLRGEILGTSSKQSIKIKFKGAVDFPAGVCPLAAGSDARITSVECFVPNAAFNGATACAGTYTPMLTDPTQGLCFPAPAYIANPAGTPLIAVQGLLF